MFQTEEQFYMLIHIFQRSTATLKTIFQIAVIAASIWKHPTWCNFVEACFPDGFYIFFFYIPVKPVFPP